MYFMCSKLNAIWLSVQRNSCAEWYPNMKDDIVDEYFQQPEYLDIILKQCRP